MKPFDLEAAKGGALFEHELAPGVRGKFIGIRENGSIVYEELDEGEITWAPAESLRMLPRKVTRWANVYRRVFPSRPQREWVGGLHESKAEAIDHRAPNLPRREWLGVTRVEWEE